MKSQITWETSNNVSSVIHYQQCDTRTLSPPLSPPCQCVIWTEIEQQGVETVETCKDFEKIKSLKSFISLNKDAKEMCDFQHLRGDKRNSLSHRIPRPITHAHALISLYIYCIFHAKMISLDNWTIGTVAWLTCWHMPTLNNANFQMVCFCNPRQPVRLCSTPTISAQLEAACTCYQQGLNKEFGGRTGTESFFQRRSTATS